MYKKIITLFIGAAMSLLLCAGVGAEESYDGYLYFTVERITLGQGFAVEPTRVGYYEEENLQAITKRFLGDKCILTASSWGEYLSGIVDGGEPKGWTPTNIPKPIMEKLKTVSGRYTSNELCEFDYSTQSGWQFTIDDISLSVGASSVTYSKNSSDGAHYTDNSVVRVQFSAYNWGADIGCLDWATGTNEFSENNVNTFADKSILIKKIADINYANEQSDYGESYTAAMAVLEDWDAATTEIQNAVDNLRKAANTEIIGATSTATSLKYITEIAFENEISAFGTTFIPLWLFETGSTDTATVEYDNENYNISNGQTYGATLTNIPESYKDIAIVGKSYFKDTDGNYTWSSAVSASINDTTLNNLDY